MILFYSGATSTQSLPERVLADKKPGVMLTFYEIYNKRGDTLRRFERHEQRRLKGKRNARKSRNIS